MTCACQGRFFHINPALASDLEDRLHRREAAELKRLHQVIDLISMKGCQTNALAAHFGEQRDQPCGHCSGCLGENATLPERKSPGIGPGLWQEVEQLQRQESVLSDPQLLARMLCGITSPQLSRNRLSRHPLFGCLAKVPFEQVLAQCSDRNEQPEASIPGCCPSL